MLNMFRIFQQLSILLDRLLFEWVNLSEVPKWLRLLLQLIILHILQYWSLPRLYLKKLSSLLLNWSFLLAVYELYLFLMCPRIFFQRNFVSGLLKHPWWVSTLLTKHMLSVLDVVLLGWFCLPKMSISLLVLLKQHNLPELSHWNVSWLFFNLSSVFLSFMQFEYHMPKLCWWRVPRWRFMLVVLNYSWSLFKMPKLFNLPVLLPSFLFKWF